MSEKYAVKVSQNLALYGKAVTGAEVLLPRLL